MPKLLRDFVRIENDFTIIPNEILRNKEMKSSTKNILLTMFSLPSTWDFSIAGIASCVFEGRETVQKALVELEKIGYITRKRERRKNGTLGAMIYTIHQFPVSKEQNTYKSNFPNQHVKNQKQVNQVLDSKTQLRTNDKLNTNNKNTDMDAFNSLELKGREKTGAENRTDASFPEAKEARQIKLPSKTAYTLEELKAYITSKIHELYIREKGKLDDCAEELIRIILYFYDRYYFYRKEKHPILSDMAYRKILLSYLCPPESMIENDEYSFDAYRKMIDKYFQTDFGKRNGTPSGFNYRISHFMSENILEHKYLQTQGDL